MCSLGCRRTKWDARTGGLIDTGRDRPVWLRRGGFRYFFVGCDTGRTDRLMGDSRLEISVLISIAFLSLSRTQTGLRS